MRAETPTSHSPDKLVTGINQLLCELKVSFFEFLPVIKPTTGRRGGGRRRRRRKVYSGEAGGHDQYHFVDITIENELFSNI